MANLDDFFAKRDKKRKNKKIIYAKANTEVLAKNLEDKKTKDIEKENLEMPPLATTLRNSDYEEKQLESSGLSKEADDEWLEYASKEKDYSGLKIETLKVEDEVSSSSERDEEYDNEEEDEEEENRGHGVSSAQSHLSGNGPWNKGSSGTLFSSSSNMDKDKDGLSKESSTSGVPSYIPPGRRTNLHRPLDRRSKVAPDINSQIYFPSLGSSLPPSSAEDSKLGAFEEVRGNGGSSIYHKSEAPQLSLGNKFSSLEVKDGSQSRNN